MVAATLAQRYNVGMIHDNIREHLDRDPFVPFRLVLSSGEHYDVVDPHSAALLKSEVFVLFPDEERWAHIPLLHIASIEAPADGRRRRPPRPKR